MDAEEKEKRKETATDYRGRRSLEKGRMALALGRPSLVRRGCSDGQSMNRLPNKAATRGGRSREVLSRIKPTRRESSGTGIFSSLLDGHIESNDGLKKHGRRAPAGQERTTCCGLFWGGGAGARTRARRAQHRLAAAPRIDAQRCRRRPSQQQSTRICAPPLPGAPPLAARVMLAAMGVRRTLALGACCEIVLQQRRRSQDLRSP